MTYLFWICIPLRNIHHLAALTHHRRHPVHAVVRLNLSRRQLGHISHLVHLLGKRLLGEEHLGLLVGFLRLALFEKILNLLLEERVLLGGL